MRKPQLFFLVRGSACLIVMLVLWWRILQPPMLSVLQPAESVALRLFGGAGSQPIVEDTSGDWGFVIPVNDSGPGSFRSVEFSMPRSDVVLFTFSLPVYWAIVLALPLGRWTIRPLLWGTALVSLIQVLSFLTELEILASVALAQLHGSSGPLSVFAREFGSRLVVGVIPFAAPVLTAVALHPDLRQQILVPQPVVEGISVGLGKTERRVVA